MKQKQTYSTAFREQALRKVYSRGSRSVAEVAEDLNLSQWTLKNWMKAVRKQTPEQVPTGSKRPPEWSRVRKRLFRDVIAKALDI